MQFSVNNEVVTFDENEYQSDFDDIVDLINVKLNLEHQRLFECHFVDKATILDINTKYRNKNYVTDVISFAFDDSEIITPLLGEMYICYEKAIEQAKEYNHSLRREICFLFTHGLLHLLGYDHENEADEKVMFKLQDEILEELKISR
ncbi:rRNA maturation factor [Ureaplasma diversum]|uniref:Endoribonuclease YbeY n=2 Tax=Ureaplasma diversum TaxID=42094 RepID=A0A084F1H1_9BACT|nr:rRNA maturation RNase YbeY [Ureaplasma diversum]AJQ45464.1 rRNA maturation factor [Ureaplasma diversum]KEZ24063.1 Hypothetical protein, putative UPF0054 family [Ureaplasma diversum NCTC 246]